MKRTLALFILVIVGVNSSAQGDKLSLQTFLAEVQSKSPEAVARLETIRALEDRLDRGQSLVSPEAYFNYNLLDDRKPTQMPQMMGDRTRVSVFRLGLRDQTTTGLMANLYFDTQDTRIWGPSPIFVPMNPYRDTRAVLELRQSFWRNGFGEQTRADVEQARKGSEAQLAQEKFLLAHLLMQAENTYWELASYNEIVKLQQENVERARKLRDYMKKRAGMRLFDNVDAMQTQAAFEARELEYQSSLDERNGVINRFNTLRGLNSKALATLDPLPTSDWRKVVNGLDGRKMKRGDFEAMRAQALAQKAGAKSSRSQLRPQLDVVASVATTGRDPTFDPSLRKAQDFDHPTYTVGLQFSVGLDFGLLSRLRSSFEREQRAADASVQRADFHESREWQDVLEKKQEAIGRYDRAVSLEKLYGEIVSQERQRLTVGRTTTFQLLKLEQDLAGMQVQRVRVQLALLQIHNALKLFEE